MRVRITQLDGALPNLAVLNLASWHRSRGDEVRVTRRIERDLFEGSYDRVYGSVLFDFSRERLKRFRAEWPGALVGGTGAGHDQLGVGVAAVTGETHRGFDYSDYPQFTASIGYTSRGCRLRCKFCVVPLKEGRPQETCTMEEIWRGETYPRTVHLLDNDFFGQPEPAWRARVQEMQEGHFKVCLSQGVNVRLLTQAQANALAQIEYRNTQFTQRRLYCAWDNLGDEAVFFRGIDHLERAGIDPQHIMVYMLVGFDPKETWERIWQRFSRMVSRGVRPYPMVYARDRRDLRAFQRWVVMGLYRRIPWEEYNVSIKGSVAKGQGRLEWGSGA